MVNLLRKIFIKNYQDVKDPKIRTKHGYLASGIGIVTNLILFIIKLLIGILSFSISIISDAINNLTDMASSFVNLFGFKLASKPADKEHPYGHERIEYIAGLIVSFIILIIAGILGYNSVIKIIEGGTSDFSILTFIILGCSILLKLLQGYCYFGIGKAINSVSLKASFQDSIGDVISTSVVLIASIIEFIFPEIKLDGYMGVLVALFIIVMGIKMVIETSNPLIGTTPDKDFVNCILTDIKNYDGVLGIHDVISHSYGPTKIFVSVHVEVDAKVDVLVSHDLIDNIENEIGKKYNILLVIHLDPIITDSKEVNDLKDVTTSILKNKSNLLTFHDFRVVFGNTHTNILFDVVVPYSYEIKEDELLEYLITEFKKIDTKYCLVVKIDREFID